MSTCYLFTINIFTKAKITLNLTGIIAWTMFLHNKNHAILDDAEGFGSTYLSFSTIDLEVGETRTELGITVALSLTIVRKIEDITSNYCQHLPDDEPFDLDNCLGEFYARSIGCLSPWERYFSTAYPPCQNDLHAANLTEYQRLKLNVTDEGGEKHVYEVTGCKSGCNMKKYAATVKEKMRVRNASEISDNKVFYV